MSRLEIKKLSPVQCNEKGEIIYEIIANYPKKISPNVFNYLPHTVYRSTFADCWRELSEHKNVMVIIKRQDRRRLHRRLKKCYNRRKLNNQPKKTI